MTETKFRRLKVLHLVGADNATAPNALLLPVLTRGARQRIENQVVHFAVGDTQFGVVRQSGIPVHEVPLSVKRFSFFSLPELKTLLETFKPDVVHSWGATAQFVASRFASSGKNAPAHVWSVARTTPLAGDAGFMDKQILQWTNPAIAKRIVFSSAVAAGTYRRAGWPENTSTVIPAGIDAERFKPDPAARERVRKQLELPPGAIVIGMHAPYSPEFDHATLLKAVGELIRANTNLYCVLAGRAMQKGNAALMSAIGGGTLGTRTRLIGEWSDIAALFNACDVVVSSATTDTARLALAMAMSCGIPCVGTGVGAQGEILGNFGVSVEVGSPAALQRGLSRVLEMPLERRAFVIHEARKHIWQNFRIGRSIERLHELYIELAPEELRESLSKSTGSQASNALPSDLATFVPPPKPQQKPAAETVAEANSAEVATTDGSKKSEADDASKDGASAASTLAVRLTPETEWSLDAALSTQALKVKPVSDLKTETESVEWSAAESELISSMMVEADPATIKPVVVERPKPKPVVQVSTADAEQAEAKARAARLLAARRAELQSTTANAHQKGAPPAGKAAKG